VTPLEQLLHSAPAQAGTAERWRQRREIDSPLSQADVHMLQITFIEIAFLSRPAMSRPARMAAAQSVALWKRMMTAKVFWSDDLLGLLALCCRACLLSSSCFKPHLDLRLFLLTSQPFFLFCGPNVLQGREHALRLADRIACIRDARKLEVFP